MFSPRSASPLLTTLSHHLAPSQTLPDHFHDPSLKFSPRSAPRINTHDGDGDDDGDNGGWDNTLRPIAHDPSTSRVIAHSRESSLEKLQSGSLAGIPESPQSPPASSTINSPLRSAASRPSPGGIFERLVDPKAAAAYGHHRQTSIVHGIQHSRNGSLASSSSSPLSPQMIAAAGAGLLPDRPDLPTMNRLDSELSTPSSMASMASIASRPLTALSGTTANASIHSTDKSEASTIRSTQDSSSSGTVTQKKVERMHSKTRRDHNHHHSHSSRHHRDEPKTVGEYAMHVLFTSFIAMAEDKLDECIKPPFDPEPSIEQICGPGADPAFDRFIIALGHIASQKPRPLIDSIMLWRKHKSEAANEARGSLHQMRSNVPNTSLVRRNTEPLQLLTGNPGDTTPSGTHTLAEKQNEAAHAERRSIVSIYILCRVLLEVISQSSLSSITPEMEDKLEAIIFGQLKIADIEQLYVSPLKLANWNLFAQLLGAMSVINFCSVADRFIADLGRSLSDLNVKSPTTQNRDPEGQVELVLGGMKHLHIKIDTDESWDQTCGFLVSLGKLFAQSHGQKVKSAFCQILDTLLLPIAAKATNKHFSYLKWSDVLSNISPRLATMFVKPRHWLAAFPLTATMLCVSSPENLSNQWLQLVRTVQPRLKDRAVRPLCLQVISRLLWAYLYRTNDSMAGATRKLDEVLQLVLPTSKRTFSAADTATTGPLIQIIRIIGYKYPEYCCTNIIFPLINAELFNLNKELKVDQLEPDRMVIGIRAFLAIMSDLEKGDLGRPPFPQHYSSISASDRVPPSSPASTSASSVIPSSPLLPDRDESLSRPVQLGALSEGAKANYKKFSEILGKITVVCDYAFGGQAALDEKFSSPGGGPKTPIAETFNFSRRDDHPSPADQKQAFYELLHVAVQALPRCLPADIPFNSLINLLCTGTAHVQTNIAESSAQSLKSIARQSYAHQVTVGFARFIFNFDDRYSTMSDGGMLGPGHIESTLRLYVELLQIWRDEIRRKTKDAASDPTDLNGADKRGMKLDLSSIWAEVEHVEARGLFFLCSQSRRVRHFAITVLRLIVEFDNALGKDSEQEKDTVRLIDILENDSVQVMNFKDEHLSIAERSRLQRGMQNSNNKGALIDLCTSDVSYDTTLWFKIFPNFIRIAYDRCPFTVTIGRDLVCNRILQMYKGIVVLSEPTRGLYYGSEPGSAKYTGRTPTTQPDVLVEQWKLYLAFACTTLTDSGTAMNGASQGSQHTRKGSKSADKIVSARTLFKFLIPLLFASSRSVREAVVLAMGSININIYRTLLEELQGHVSRCNEEARARIHQRTGSGPRRNPKMDTLRAELTHVYKLTCHFLKEPEVYQDDWILSNLCTYTKDIKLFLMDGEVQMDWEFQKLRQHYCGLVEGLFDGINRTKDPSRWMTFESRKSSFTLMEDWCGFSPNQMQIRQREDTMRQSLIDKKSLGERGPISAGMEIEKRNLKTAALSAMAALCAGPVSVTTESGATLHFDMRRMLNWVDSIFSSGSDRVNVIGRRALKNLIVYNQDHPYLLEHCIARCYITEVPKVLESYFTVITEVLQEHIDYPTPFWKLLGLCLFTLGSDQSDIRSKSAHIVEALEERQQAAQSSKISDFEISIADKTKAVYKLAQFEISKRLSKKHPELAFHVFSEVTLYFKSLPSAAQRNVVAVILPWIQEIELKVDPNGGPTAQSYVLLANLLEVTIKSSAALHNEVQALWQALATGGHSGNVQLVLDFIISLCLERREQNFVEYAKQIVVFLSSTPSTNVVEFLLMQITPKAMVPNEKRDAIQSPPDISQLHLPYCADLSEALPVGTKQAGFSLGQLSLILLVDLMVSPAQLDRNNLIVLLQVVTVLWDHYTPLVQEQAREMLVHLIHELVVSKMDEKTPPETKNSVEDVVDAIRRHDRAVVWSYEESNGKVDGRDNKVPRSMEHLTAEVVKTFEVTFPGIKEEWSRLSLTWATSCPVRHLACRSFQIFRCILTSLDQFMLGDMLARLSNTIADEDTEIQTFSMEILTTLKTLISKLEPEKLMSFPQLFWTMCSCLDSINEVEFLEAIEMLNEYLKKLDFHSPSIRRALMDGQPPRWEGTFEGVQPLLFKGLRSSICLQPTLDTLDKLVQLPSGNLIGNDNRLFFSILANFPRFLQAMEQDVIDKGTLQTAEILFSVADAQGMGSISAALGGLVDSIYRSSRDFMTQLLAALREFFLPQLDFNLLTTLMGFLTNSMPWMKIMTMRLLCVVIPEIEMRKPEIAGHGSDLISPLFRLLQTEYCMEALEVLDNIMTMSGTPMDKHYVRMSMTSAASKDRKDYETTQSLFGIPEESGWSIPIPAKKTELTRANIHASFYMCQANPENGTPADPTPTEEVEFHEDNYRYGYFDMPDRTETMMSDDAQGEGQMADLVTKLDSLDDFFDDMSQTSPSEGRSSRTVTEFGPDSYESGARLYDDVLPILHQASTNTSFQNGFVDRVPASKESKPNTMNPAAFNLNPAALARPGLHSRSITSPSAPASWTPPHLGELTSDDELTEDVFSDGDDDRPANGAPESSFFLENMIKPIAQTTRTHMRRLTGGGRSRDHAEKQRELFRARQQQVSPQVPKVPNSFLQHKASPSTGEML
ncbi:cell morphogenesis N-terminal-domain-containing protein [Annulohypoxylon moriforme]|nr:cell morphogenesis N-terminal-domain-containing protein [Annulohypoxylon moriforme]